MDAKIKGCKTYWDYLVHEEWSYQMGPKIHRLAVLDEMKELGIHSLLDVGCGTGPIYDLLKRDRGERWGNIVQYKGVDYSWGMINVCKREMPDGDWEIQDIRHLKEKSNSWDCVLLMHSLDHVVEYEVAIKEVTRVARKYVIIILWRGFTQKDTNWIYDRNKFCLPEGKKSWKDTWMQEYSEDLLRKEFEKNKLVSVKEMFGPEVNEKHTTNYIFILEKQ